MLSKRSKSYKIINRKRFTCFISIASIFIMSIILMPLQTKKAYSVTDKIPYKELIVNRGDTLWYIAGNHMPENYDVRKMVFEIMKLNEMMDANIHPGDLLKIPIK